MNKITITMLAFILFSMQFNTPLITDSGFLVSHYSELTKYSLTSFNDKSQNKIANDFFSDMIIDDIDYSYSCNMKDGDAQIKIVSEAFGEEEYYLKENHFCSMDKWDSIMKKYGVITFNINMAKSDGWMLYEYDYIVDLELNKDK